MPTLKKEKSPEKEIHVILDTQKLSRTEAEQALEAISALGLIRKTFTTGGLSKNPKLFAAIDEFPGSSNHCLGEKEIFTYRAAEEVRAVLTDCGREEISVAIVAGDDKLHPLAGLLALAPAKAIVVGPPEMKSIYAPLAEVFISVNGIRYSHSEVERKVVRIVNGLSNGEWISLAILSKAIREDLEPSEVKQMGRLRKFLSRCPGVEIELSLIHI